MLLLLFISDQLCVFIANRCCINAVNVHSLGVDISFYQVLEVSFDLSLNHSQRVWSFSRSLPAIHTQHHCFGIRYYPCVLVLHHLCGGAQGISTEEEESEGGEVLRSKSLHAMASQVCCFRSLVTGCTYMDQWLHVTLTWNHFHSWLHISQSHILGRATHALYIFHLPKNPYRTTKFH